MDETNTWTDLFFSGHPPEIVKAKETSGEEGFRLFQPEAENWILGELVDKSRRTNEKNIQVFWLWSNGRTKCIGKVVG